MRVLMALLFVATSACVPVDDGSTTIAEDCQRGIRLACESLGQAYAARPAQPPPVVQIRPMAMPPALQASPVPIRPVVSGTTCRPMYGGGLQCYDF